MRFELVLALAFALAFSLGCGEGLPFLDADAATDADAGPFTPGPHDPLPQATNASGTGGVLTAPNVVPVFYANDALQSGIEALFAELPSSSYWSTLESEYGVGPLTVAPSIVVSDAPPSTASDVDIIAFIASKIGSDPAWPAPTPNTIYFMYYPASTTLTFAPSAAGCVDFAGYHEYGQNSPTSKFAFAVAARCNTNQAPIDEATVTTTHEIVEASTDPFLLSYATMDDAHIAWALYPGAEIGDLCELESLSYQRLVGTSLVARFWSNSSAAAGHDPCAPAIAIPYFNSTPVLPDAIAVTFPNETVVTNGVAIPIGTSKTIDVQLFSDAPMGDWTVEADDGISINNASELQLTWDTTTGNNGDTLHLTITRTKEGAFGGTEFVIRSYASSTIWHEYFGWVGN